MSDNEPTTGELARRFDRLDASIESGFHRIYERLDRMVSTEVFTVNQAAMNARLEGLSQKDTALEQKIDRTEEHRRSDRRTTITSLFSAGIAILLAVSGWVVTALNTTPIP